jgi:hypothetical protein
MLDEYAITPDIFNPAAYSNAAFIDMCLPHLKELVLREALVRDLCDGGWSQFCMTHSSGMHRLCKEIVRKLQLNNRLRRFPQNCPSKPISSTDWCNEGLGSSKVDPVTGVIASHITKLNFTQGEVASIEKLTGAPWWQSRSTSASIDRKTAEYKKLLHRILMQSNSLMFVDPNLDPASHNYREFFQLFTPLAERQIKPLIEIHRSICKGDGKARTFPTEMDWKNNFATLGAEFKCLGLSAEIFLWDDFHIRLLITDLVGVNLEAGFDVTAKPNDRTAWARLGRQDKDNWQKEFDPATREPKCRFTIGL